MSIAVAGEDSARSIAECDGALEALAAAVSNTETWYRALFTLHCIAKAGDDLAARVAGITGLIDQVAYEWLDLPDATDEARSAGRLLEALATHGCVAQVAVALAPYLVYLVEGVYGRARTFLNDVFEGEGAAMSAFEGAAREIAALRPEMAELGALPANIKAAIVDLAGTVRG